MGRRLAQRRIDALPGRQGAAMKAFGIAFAPGEDASDHAAGAENARSSSDFRK